MKSNHNLFLLGVLTLLHCSSPREKTEQISYKDVCEGYDVIDAEMLQVIDKIEEVFSADRQFLARFRDSQVYWIQYKDRHLRALYSKDWDLFYRKNYSKQVFNSCKCKELIRLTELRVKELKWYLNDGPSDQNDCPSAWNTKKEK